MRSVGPALLAVVLTVVGCREASSNPEGVDGGVAPALDAGPDGRDAGHVTPDAGKAVAGDAGSPSPEGCARCGRSHRCLTHPVHGAECVASCPRERVCGERACCPLGSRCVDEACVLPNLRVDADRIATSWDVRTRHFRETSCALEEGCIEDFGDRRLLRFELRTPNVGEGDLFLGAPDETPELFEYSMCHGHHHFLTYAAYELRDADGAIVARGHKQSFCLIDIARFDPAAGPAQYDCELQGISAGWADIYGKHLDCQWVDVTDVPPGDYVLRVDINTEQVLAETDYDDNFAEVAIRLE